MVLLDALFGLPFALGTILFLLTLPTLISGWILIKYKSRLRIALIINIILWVIHTLMLVKALKAFPNMIQNDTWKEWYPFTIFWWPITSILLINAGGYLRNKFKSLNR